MGLPRLIVIALAILTTAGVGAATPPAAPGTTLAQPPTPPGAETLPLAIDAVLRVPVMLVEIGGEQVPCIVDTGSYRSTFDAALLRRLWPEAARHRPTDTVHRDVLQLTLPGLRLGSDTCSNLPVYETDLSHISGVSPCGVRGILGMDVLARRPFTLSFTRHTLTMGDARAPEGTPPLEVVREGNRFFIRVKLDDTGVFMLVDTGANRSQLDASTWSGPREAGMPIHMRHLGAGETVLRIQNTRVSGLSIGSHHLGARRILLADFNLLGVDLIGEGDWHFDPASAAVSWSRPAPSLGATAGSHPRLPTGLRLPPLPAPVRTLPPR